MTGDITSIRLYPQGLPEAHAQERCLEFKAPGIVGGQALDSSNLGLPTQAGSGLRGTQIRDAPVSPSGRLGQSIGQLIRVTGHRGAQKVLQDSPSYVEAVARRMSCQAPWEN